ncbi:hypothetical protein BDV93DRAFT_524930 [Ceratobasidium sp. AG-I]|nr:hypothetical protein BDV93DRAFT_524930 [Ceratobasidium sp. AG-I]
MSGATAPPSYDAAMADVEKLKSKMNIDTQKKAEDAMATEFAKPETNKKLLEEVRALGDAAIKVDQTFSKVSSQLADVDNNNYKDKNGKPIPKLKPQWDGFHERFKHTLWSSRDVATDTATYILDFYETYLPAIDEAIDIMATQTSAERAETIKDLQPDFDAFLKKQNPATAQSNRPPPAGSDPLSVSQVQSQDFLDLKNDIEAFKGTFNTFAEGTSEELNQKLNKVNSNISRLNLEITGYETIIKALAIAMGATVLVAGAGAIGALVAFGPLGPAVALGVLIVGAIAVISELGALIAYLVKKADAEDELAKAKVEKADLEKQLATLEALKSKLEEQTTDINYITGRLDQFANIWSLVASDARECNTQLKNASEAKGYTFLKSRTALLKRSYASLYTGLKEYATKVTDSGVSKPASK